MLTLKDVNKIAHLARINMTDSEAELSAPQLSGILGFIEKMNQVDTRQVEPLAHPFEVMQRLRKDVVTETNQRDKYQKIAPQVEAGLYLVPKVIE